MKQAIPASTAHGEEDNPYVVTLDPAAFDALLSEVEAALQGEIDAGARHTSALQRALVALQAADAQHVCVDEMPERPAAAPGKQVRGMPRTIDEIFADAHLQAPLASQARLEVSPPATPEDRLASLLSYADRLERQADEADGAAEEGGNGAVVVDSEYMDEEVAQPLRSAAYLRRLAIELILGHAVRPSDTPWSA